MVTGRTRASLNKRWLAWSPSLAALACLVIMLFLLVQIDSTRKQLQDNGVLEFNYLQQVEHDLTSYAQSLIAYLHAPPKDSKPLRTQIIQRFDSLYSSIFYTDPTQLGQLLALDETQLFLESARHMLTTSKPLMTAKHSLSKEQILQLNSNTLALSHTIHKIGLSMFERYAMMRQPISQRMGNLNVALWFFSTCFALVSLLSLMLFASTMRQVANLRAAAKQTNTQLYTALDELTTGDIKSRSQKRFMAAASHDLRQPLHALGLYLNALEKHVSTEQGQIILCNINRSTEALRQLLNSMLDLSKLDAGVVDVNFTSLSLDSVFDNLRQNFLLEANHRKLVLDIQNSGLHVRSDQLLLERILGNLVANALNYTQSGSVSVQASQENSHLACICVSDTGPGIPVDEQNAIFNEYYQLQDPKRDRTKGLGLGLSIVKRLSKLLDINLQLSSTIGIGTRFSLTLPLTSQEETDAWNSDNGDSPANCQDAPVSGLAILVIDDEQDVRDGMLTLLRQQGYDVAIAESSAQACEHIINNDWVPELIIADYRLRDDKTGVLAIKRVREEINIDVPAMIITGDTSPARLREASASGFHLLHKPVIVNDLFKAIIRLLGDRA